MAGCHSPQLWWRQVAKGALLDEPGMLALEVEVDIGQAHLRQQLGYSNLLTLLIRQQQCVITQG